MQLIEILVVVVILGILAAVVVPNLMDQPDKAADQVRRALEAAGIVLLSTDRGQGVLLVHGQDEKRHRQIHDA